MSTEPTILGTSGKEIMPLEYQTQGQLIARKRRLAEAMLARGMAGPRQTQMFGNYASAPGLGEHVLSALQTYMGMKGQGAADDESAQLAGRYNEAQQADLQRVMAEHARDPKAGIAAALASQFGRSQGLAKDWSKSREDMLMAQGKMLGDADPIRGIKHLQADNTSAEVAPLTQPEPAFGTDPTGNAYAVTRDLKGGKPTLSYAPKDMQVKIDNKLTAGVNEDAAKYFNYGGKGYDKGTAANQSLQVTANLLDTLDKNPTMGAGADLIQLVRKWGSTLGAPISEKTTPTEMASMQLGQKTLDRLGGLGAQVSDADRKFMLETQGSLGNDPEAVRRMLLIEAKYLMQVQAKLSGDAKGVAARIPGVALPSHEFSFAPSQRNADDLERLFTNQGFAAPAAVTPPVQYPGRIRKAR